MGKKVVIVGGVAGGASTAARLRRLDEKAEIVLLERGGYISFANCGLPYYIGDVITKRGNLLVTTKEQMQARFNIDVRLNSEAVAILRDQKQVRIAEGSTGKEYLETYDELVLATGSSPIVPPIPGADGEGVFTLWNMADTDRLKAYVQEKKPQSAVVVGGGFIGLEMVENLRHLDILVSLVEMQSQVMTNLDEDMAVILHRELRDNHVALYLNSGVTAVGDMQGKKLVSLDTGRQIKADLVVLSIGVRPNNTLAKEAGLTLGERGGVVVDGAMRTSDPYIYAVGDVVQIRNLVSGKPAMIPLAGPANRQGRGCADVLAGQDFGYSGAMGASVAKVFRLSVASVGLNRRQLEETGKLGEDFFALRTNARSHAAYYPGATPLALKLYYGEDGRILGAQAVGEGGADKRIDVIATAMKLGADVRRLKDLELCYAPPFSSAKDPVNMLGYMAENQMKGLTRFIQYHQLRDIDADDMIILDVREESEVLRCPVEGAVHIPLGMLRERLRELDKNKKVIVMCAVGVRAHTAARILSQHGFPDVAVYAGGYTTYQQTRELVANSD